MSEIQLGAIFGTLGLVLLVFRDALAGWATQVYAKLGFQVDASAYARQFRWVGIALLVLGLALVV